MKKVIFITSIVCLLLLYILPTRAQNDSPIKWVEYCRCHNDGTCQLGSPISFRPACAIVYVPSPGQVIDCSGANGNCKSNDTIEEGINP